MFGAVPNLSLRQRLKLKVFGHVFLRWIKPEDYVGSVAVYAVNCKQHGLYLDYPHGYNQHFQCDSCFAESKGRHLS
jgi:hypothetical protein